MQRDVGLVFLLAWYAKITEKCISASSLGKWPRLTVQSTCYSAEWKRVLKNTCQHIKCRFVLAEVSWLIWKYVNVPSLGLILRYRYLKPVKAPLAQTRSVLDQRPNFQWYYSTAQRIDKTDIGWVCVQCERPCPGLYEKCSMELPIYFSSHFCSIFFSKDINSIRLWQYQNCPNHLQQFYKCIVTSWHAREIVMSELTRYMTIRRNHITNILINQTGTIRGDGFPQ